MIMDFYKKLVLMKWEYGNYTVIFITFNVYMEKYSKIKVILINIDWLMILEFIFEVDIDERIDPR